MSGVLLCVLLRQKFPRPPLPPLLPEISFRQLARYDYVEHLRPRLRKNLPRTISAASATLVAEFPPRAP